MTTTRDLTEQLTDQVERETSGAGLRIDRVSAPPKMLHHLAYVTHDVEATVDFYTRILGMKLVSTIIDDSVPSTGDPFPYLHLFFELSDGSTIAFFESLDLPPAAEPTHPAYAIFNHLALDAGSAAEVDRWAEHLRGNGVDVLGPIDHKIIYSVYFHDPNGLRLELTATTDAAWKDHEKDAATDVAEWIELKRRTASSGSSAEAIEWIRRRRAKHKQSSVES